MPPRHLARGRPCGAGSRRPHPWVGRAPEREAGARTGRSLAPPPRRGGDLQLALLQYGRDLRAHVSESLPPCWGQDTQPCREAARSSWIDRKGVLSGKSVSVRVALGGRRIIIKKQHLE